MSRKSYIIISLMLLSVGCANRGMGPQGGPKDETPPKLVKEIPQNGELNYHGKLVELFFDEYVQLDNPSENVLISPPQQRAPEVRSVAKKVTVRFDEDLQDSTTYTINFGSAIADNNEKNALENFSFSFSTGDVIDSMEIGGLLLNAADLNYVSRIIIGAHLNHADSAFTTQPFTRIGRTGADGRFVIKNLKHGDYRLFALNDVSKDYMYQPSEGLAFYPDIVTPTSERHMASDTLWRDSISSRMVEGERVRDTLTIIDTIITKERTFFHPDTLVLLYFNEEKVRRYFQRALREKQHVITLLFNAPQDSMPVLRPLVEDDMLGRIVTQSCPTLDTITLWLRDSSLIAQDTLRFEMTYYKTDSVYQLYAQTDTIQAIYRAPRLSAAAKAKKEREKEKQHFVELKTNIGKAFEIYAPLTFTFSTPIDSMTPGSFHIFEMRDTVPVPLSLSLVKADSIGMRYEVMHQWKPQTTYKYELDSAAFTDIYGDVNSLKKGQFTIRSLDEYSTLTIKLTPHIDQAVIEILDSKDQVVRRLKAQADGTRFEHLTPDSYYMRLFVDSNNDGVWTTGDWAERRQPEQVFYFPNKLTLRANWDFEESWDAMKLPIDRQKPAELRKDANERKK